MTKQKTPLSQPHCKDSELMVLGCAMNSINCLNSTIDALVEKDFYFLEHQVMFSILASCYKNDQPAHVGIVLSLLKDKDLADKAGGNSYVVNCAAYSGVNADVDAYIRVVKGKSTLRKMLSACQEIAQEIYKAPDDADDVLDFAQNLFFQIGKDKSKDFKLMKDILNGSKSESGKSFIHLLEERQERYKLLGDQKGVITGLETHFPDLDKMLNGFNKSNLMILAARPAMGKTSLAMNIAENISFKNDCYIGVFSLEMSADQLTERIFCSQAEIPAELIKTGAAQGGDYQRLLETYKKLETNKIIFDDQAGLKVTELRSRARRMKETYDIKFLVIDYLQMLSGTGTKISNENRQNEVSEISRMLKNLARELDIPILCLSQLSRKVEERESKKPMMSDLRDSGALEQDADIVMFLYRHEYYNSFDRPGRAELTISKNRHGEIGTVQLYFKKELAKFYSIDPFLRGENE